MEELPKWSAPSSLMSIPGPTKTGRTSDTKPAALLIMCRNVVTCGFCCRCDIPHDPLGSVGTVPEVCSQKTARECSLCDVSELGKPEEHPHKQPALETSSLCSRIALEMQGWLFSKLLGHPRALKVSHQTKVSWEPRGIVTADTPDWALSPSWNPGTLYIPGDHHHSMGLTL